MLNLIIAALVFVNAPDGDTMVLRDGNVKIVLRLAEIDAPERTQPYSQVRRRN
jgi:endonuclease YncB( thermonuclease family)